MNEILILPVNVMKQNIRFANIKHYCFCNCSDAYGPYYFDTIRNWDKEKNKLLQIYGYSLDDDLEWKI